MVTGWGNEDATDAVRRTLRGQSSGRLTVLVIAAAFLALSIYAGNLYLAIASGAVAALALALLVRAGLRRWQRLG